MNPFIVTRIFGLIYKGKEIERERDGGHLYRDGTRTRMV